MLPVEWILKSQCDAVRWNRQLPGQLEVDASWITLEGANEEEVIIIIVVKTAEERLHRCLRIKEEFLAWNERKNERIEKIEAGEYVVECLMEHDEYVLWRDC
jgi:hypothetical protein